MKRFISLICALLSLSLLASCKSEEPEDTATPYDEAAEFREDEGEIFQDVPNEKYDGYTFRVLSAKTGLPSSKVDSDGITGSTISDTIYQRNTNVQSRLGIIIDEVRDTPEKVHDLAVASVLANEDVYSAIWNYSSYMGTMAANGYLVSSDYLLKADYEKPWWNTRAMEQTSVSGASFLLYGDLQLSYYDAHSMVGVNMELLEKISGLADPYSLVDAGTWTLDAMISMMRAAENDIDGNATMNSEDGYGLAAESDMVLQLMYGCDVRMSDKDDLDLPYITCISSEKFFDVYTLISQNIFSSSTYVYDVEKNSADGMDVIDMFKEENTLFVVTTLGELEHLRSMDCEFGVLPMPKYADYQSEYISYISGDAACALGIPVTGRNFLRTGVILENMAAESYRKGGLRDVYVDSVLAFRYVDDERSRESLDIILASGTFDLAELYGWGGLSDTVTALCADGAEKLSSSLAQDKADIEADMYEFIDMILDF